MVAQNDTIRTNYVKAKIDDMLKNSKHMLGGNRHKRANHIISKCIKLSQKGYKTRYDPLGIVQEIKI